MTGRLDKSRGNQQRQIPKGTAKEAAATGAKRANFADGTGASGTTKPASGIKMGKHLLKDSSNSKKGLFSGIKRLLKFPNKKPTKSAEGEKSSHRPDHKRKLDKAGKGKTETAQEPVYADHIDMLAAGYDVGDADYANLSEFRPKDTDYANLSEFDNQSSLSGANKTGAEEAHIYDSLYDLSTEGVETQEPPASSNQKPKLAPKPKLDKSTR